MNLYDTFRYYRSFDSSSRLDASIAVQHDGLELKWYHDEIKDDKEIALRAVKQNWIAVHYISSRLQKDKDILAVVEEKYVELTFFDILRTTRGCDKDSKFDASIEVCFNGHILGWYSDEIKDDKEIALKTVKQNWMAVRLISGRLQEDKDITKIVDEQIKKLGISFD